ncbi:MAG: hypothetical protein L3J03_11795 [Desulfobacterales bacterium]|nr:hypothetical protein [Desulfobacterales bacterium]
MPDTQLPGFQYLGFLQFDVRAGDLNSNLDQVQQGLAGLGRTGNQPPALVALPELWSSGFDYPTLPALARKTPELLRELEKLSAQYKMILAGSLAEEDQGRYYNTLYITGPTGRLGSYRKQHLFAPMGEESFFTPGTGYGPIDTPHGRLASLVCYDLRFPELARGQAAQGALFLVIAAQWPLARVDHWQTLVRARAIENQMFVIAANRCGATNDTRFAGHSLIVAPDGAILHQAGQSKEQALVAIDPGRLDTVRSRFNTLAQM